MVEIGDRVIMGNPRCLIPCDRFGMEGRVYSHYKYDLWWVYFNARDKCKSICLLHVDDFTIIGENEWRPQELTAEDREAW